MPCARGIGRGSTWPWPCACPRFPSSRPRPALAARACGGGPRGWAGPRCGGCGMAQLAEPLALIVDDDPSARRIVHRYMRSLGISVLEASDASSALRHLSELTPALICLDVT